MIGPDDIAAMRPECPMPPGPDLPRLLEAAAGRLWGEKLPADSAVERMVAEVERLRGRNAHLRGLIADCVETATEFQTDWDNAALAALRDGDHD